MKKRKYELALKELHAELIHLQQWVVTEGARVVILFEGRDAAGKGGVIKAITQRLNPRVVRIAALPSPSDTEKTQWYFQRYVNHLPSAGEMVLFDRSWYNRAGVEKVMGFCTDAEYQDFLVSSPEFERMLMRSGITLLKYWFSVSDEEQESRFKERLNNPLKRWKLSPMDLESRGRWTEYSKAKDKMFEYTDTKNSPWFVVNGEDKRAARLNCISHILKQIPYEQSEYPKLSIPAINKTGYSRPPLHKQELVPERYGKSSR